MPSPTTPKPKTAAALNEQVVKSVIENPPVPMTGTDLCAWHGEWAGGEGSSEYRSAPATFDTTWRNPDSPKHEQRRFPAAAPGSIQADVEIACEVFESYARDPWTSEKHRRRAAWTLAWFVARLIRTWPFDEYNEEMAQLALHAGAIRLGFDLSSLPLDRIEVRQDLAYASVPRAVVPPTIGFIEPHLFEHLTPIEGASPKSAEIARVLAETHGMFSPAGAAEDLNQLNALSKPFDSPSSEFLVGGRSRAGRRYRFRRNNPRTP